MSACSRRGQRVQENGEGRGSWCVDRVATGATKRKGDLRA